MKKDEHSETGMDYSDEIKKISLNVFLILGSITIVLYIYKRTNPHSFIGLEERFLATTLLFGFLSIVFHIKEISGYVDWIQDSDYCSLLLQVVNPLYLESRLNS